MPATKSTVLIYRAYPLAQGFALDLILLIFFAFDFNDKYFIV